MTSLKKLKEEAKKFYDQWRNSKTFSPAFKSNVIVSLKGWNHIIGSSRYRRRQHDDVYRRLKLLPHAKTIIEQSTTIQNITAKHGKKFYALEAMVEVSENSHTALRKVRVIFVEDKQGNKIFFSVMDKKGN